jgi:hypothetical protein
MSWGYHSVKGITRKLPIIFNRTVVKIFHKKFGKFVKPPKRKITKKISTKCFKIVLPIFAVGKIENSTKMEFFW